MQELNLNWISVYVLEMTDHLIAIVYKILLKMNLKDEYVKDFMVKWATKFGYNIMGDIWESNGLKFTLNYSSKEIFYKIMYHSYLTPDSLVKI